MFARQIGDLRASFLLPQDPDDLLFREPLLLHIVRPAIGRTLIDDGGVFQGQVTAALKAELAGFHRTLTDNTSDFKNRDIDSKSIMLVPDLSQSIRIEPQILDKIGLLTPETIQKIVAAYILVEQYHQSLVLNAGGQLHGNVTPNRRLISLKRENLQAAIALTEVTAEKIQEAIDSLTPYFT